MSKTNLSHRNQTWENPRIWEPGWSTTPASNQNHDGKTRKSHLLRHGPEPAQPILCLIQDLGKAGILVLEPQGHLQDLLQVGAPEAEQVLIQVGAGRLPQDIGKLQAAGMGGNQGLGWIGMDLEGH